MVHAAAAVASVHASQLRAKKNAVPVGPAAAAAQLAANVRQEQDAAQNGIGSDGRPVITKVEDFGLKLAHQFPWAPTSAVAVGLALRRRFLSDPEAPSTVTRRLQARNPSGFSEYGTAMWEPSLHAFRTSEQLQHGRECYQCRARAMLSPVWLVCGRLAGLTLARCACELQVTKTLRGGVMNGADSAAGWKALAELQYQNRCRRTRPSVPTHLTIPSSVVGCSGSDWTFSEDVHHMQGLRGSCLLLIQQCLAGR